MKRYILIIALLMVGVLTHAQKLDLDGFDISDGKVLEATSIKSQGETATCWAFAGISMVESELMRMGKGEVDISEMWIVRNAYFEKALRYVRMHGTVAYRSGGWSGDVFNIIAKYGILPESAYPGKQDGTARHGELSASLKAFLKAVVDNKNGTLSTAWVDGLNGLLDTYLGKVPEKFEYNSKTYTIESFNKEYFINPSDYVVLTSFQCYPENEWVQMEIPDNWGWQNAFNIKFKDFRGLIDNSINKGYTCCIACDITDDNFRKKPGLCVIPTRRTKEIRSEDLGRWPEITPQILRNNRTFAEPMPEREITGELRNQSFLNYYNTDDHLMHVIGMASDQNHTKYYKIKDSAYGKGIKTKGGYRYMSEPYYLYKTITIVMHKSAIPGDIANKMKQNEK